MLESLNRPQGRKVFDPMPEIPESIRKGTELHAKMIKLADEATGIPAMKCSCGKHIPESCRIYGKCPDCYNEVSDSVEDRLDHVQFYHDRKARNERRSHREQG